MCGICGIVKREGDKSAIERQIRQMSDQIRHRGPDDGGAYFWGDDAVVGLGHRRLSIIDLSVAGHQPMSNENGTIWVVLNGEIYNYDTLKDELLKKGHVFKSTSDTEVILHSYEEYGKDCVKHFRGMFAFALWDQNKQVLLLARDRVGKKPLLYHYARGVFCFASEFSAILASGVINKEVNNEAIHYYLTLGYIPAPITVYNGVFKLPPAHLLTLEKGKLEIEQYWQLNYQQKIDISEEEAANEVLRLLKEAVKIRLHSDVPLGAFLSGGIDSSAVVAVMSQFCDRRVKTFSIGFEDGDYNELKFARIIANRFNTDHNELIVKSDALKILPILVERYGEPFADSSCIPTYCVAQETKRYVTVALNGDGGDELFAGYERYQAMSGAEFYRGLPIILKKIISGITGIFPDSIEQKNRFRRVRRFFEGAELPELNRYMKWVGIFDDKLRRDIYTQHFQEISSKADILKFIGWLSIDQKKMSLIDRLLYMDTTTYLPGDLLTKVDIASMANSLEARSPFLDHKFMEFVAMLPARYKLKYTTKKYILKKALKDLLPDSIIHRRKMGFGIPVGKWFRNELNGFVRSALVSKRFSSRGYFKPEAIKHMVNQHIGEKADYSFQLWAILMLELWHQRYTD